MTLASDRLRQVPAPLPTEERVLAAVNAIVRRTVSTDKDPKATLVNSGLLAISIPAAFGGADISNIVVAETITSLSSWHKQTAELFVHHLVALELLRTSGTTEQRRAIYSRVVLGELFDFTTAPAGQLVPHIERAGLSFVLEASIPPNWGADWLVLIAEAAGKGNVASIISSEDRLLSDGDVELPVSPDNVLSLGPDALVLSKLMQAFLRGATCRKPSEAHTQGSVGDVTLSSVEFELLDAIVLKASSIIDTIQVDFPTLDRAHLETLCKALETACHRCSSDVTLRR